MRYTPGGELRVRERPVADGRPVRSQLDRPPSCSPRSCGSPRRTARARSWSPACGAPVQVVKHDAQVRSLREKRKPCPVANGIPFCFSMPVPMIAAHGVIRTGDRLHESCPPARAPAVFSRDPRIGQRRDGPCVAAGAADARLGGPDAQRTSSDSSRRAPSRPAHDRRDDLAVFVRRRARPRPRRWRAGRARGRRRRAADRGGVDDDSRCRPRRVEEEQAISHLGGLLRQRATGGSETPASRRVARSSVLSHDDHLGRVDMPTVLRRSRALVRAALTGGERRLHETGPGQTSPSRASGDARGIQSFDASASSRAHAGTARSGTACGAPACPARPPRGHDLEGMRPGRLAVDERLDDPGAR